MKTRDYAAIIILVAILILASVGIYNVIREPDVFVEETKKIISVENQNDAPDGIVIARIRDDYSGDITRIEDVEAGVTCWVYTGYKAGGISCLRNP